MFIVTPEVNRSICTIPTAFNAKCKHYKFCFYDVMKFGKVSNYQIKHNVEHFLKNILIWRNIKSLGFC